MLYYVQTLGCSTHKPCISTFMICPQMLALSQCTSFSSQELCDAYAKCDTTHVPAKILHKTGTIH